MSRETHSAAFIFDLDGVLVDTAKYHFLAWRRLANHLGFDLAPEDEEKLKGVPRMGSLDIVLSLGGIVEVEERKIELAELKNQWYMEYLASMDAASLLPGARRFVESCDGEGIATALASSSRNAKIVLRATGIEPLFDAVVDGNDVNRAKPAPDLFLEAARRLDASPPSCIVFEDATAGIRAAQTAGMAAVGIGSASVLGAAGADAALPGLDHVSPAEILAILESRRSA